MTFDKYFKFLIEVYNRHLYDLKVYLGYSVKEIENLEVITGRDQLERYYDEKTLDKIRWFYGHGYDPKDVKQMKTDFYLNFINKKEAEEFKNMDKKADKKKDDTFDILENLQNMENEGIKIKGEKDIKLFLEGK